MGYFRRKQAWNKIREPRAPYDSYIFILVKR